MAAGHVVAGGFPKPDKGRAGAPDRSGRCKEYSSRGGWARRDEHANTSRPELHIKTKQRQKRIAIKTPGLGLVLTGFFAIPTVWRRMSWGVLHHQTRPPPVI